MGSNDKSDVLTSAPHGTHYKALGIEPIEYIERNGLSFHEGNVVKYVTRWRGKGGIADLEKARWYLERLIELENGREEESKVPPPVLTIG